jgi:hypothetical protein
VHQRPAGPSIPEILAACVPESDPERRGAQVYLATARAEHRSASVEDLVCQLDRLGEGAAALDPAMVADVAARMGSVLEPDTRDAYLLLAGTDPGLSGTPCGRCGGPAHPGHHAVAVMPEPREGVATPLFLCGPCTRREAPILAEAAEALNVLRALVGGLAPQPAHAVSRALAELGKLLAAGPGNGGSPQAET